MSHQDSPIKILVLPVHEDGCWMYRVLQPYLSIFKQGLAEVIFVKMEELETERFFLEVKEADFVVCRLAHRDFVNQFLDKLLPGKKIILDMDDDLFDVNPYTEMYAHHGQKEVKHGDQWLWKDKEAGFDIERNKKRLEADLALIRRADIVTVSTPRLQFSYKDYNNNIFVNYNAINLEDWKPYNIEKKELRIGWTGGGSHYEDWYTIKDDIVEIMKRYPEAKLIIAGSMFEGIFKDIPQERVEFWKWVHPEGHAYRTILMNLDIAIIPLADNVFNKNKSCVKYYEFASIGVPVLARNVAPYSDELFSESLYSNLEHDIRRLADSKEERDKQAKSSREWVVKNRDLNKISLKLFEYIINKHK